jgi:molybdopterin biosynthesis enzyme MoaB
MSSPDLPSDARARVITVSDRSHGGARHDESGPLLSSLLIGLGFTEADVVVVPDEIAEIEAALRTGITDALRMFNREKVPTTILSRAVAGVAGGTIIVNLPGSPSGVRDGVSVLEPVIGHAVTQLRGGDH